MVRPTFLSKLGQGTDIFNYNYTQGLAMKHSKQNQLTRANSLQAITTDLLKRQLQKICRNNETYQVLIKKSIEESIQLEILHMEHAATPR